MKPSERDQALYLKDIILSIQRILEYVGEMNFEQFQKNYMVVDAIIRNFQIIGEASKNLSGAIKDKYPNIPWKEMYRLRNRVSHEYFGLNYPTIWDIVTKHLPQNYKRC